MSFNKAHEHEQAAQQHRENGDFVEAGECYTAAAYIYLADWPPTHRGKNVSHGEYYLLNAATCYRLGGCTDRARNRCQQGVLIAEELLDRTKNIGGTTAYDRARYAAWYEFIGDFRVVGILTEKVSAYERAEQIYFEEETHH
ncbi:hypothetical protein [Halorussus caseinilyticus]|uniref:Uncharacterized protein n=1 Tax=Halorussus caseinilyticus TaxID=3034025 RepID=A0ABD5WIH3_9EURY